MTLSEFVDLFENCGLPIAFDHFRTEQQLPYLVYIVTGNNQMAADNITFNSAPTVQLELYTELKDETKEATVESILSGFYYEKEEEYLDDERMYMVAYRLTLR